MTDKEIEKLRRVAEMDNGGTSKEAMKKLREINPTYHWCYEWDGMVICDKDKEFEACLCFKK